MTARRIMLAVGTAALLSSGAYVFVYLSRWEWHRALLAGIIFVAAEVGLGIFAVLNRLRRIEGRLESRLQSGVSSDDLQRALSHISDAAPPPRPAFQWLTDADRMSVFVPILLGAGVVLSALAWLVERVARGTAGPSLERGLALRLAPLAFPEGILTGAPAAVATHPPSLGHRGRGLAVALLAGVAAVVAVDGLADLTQDRPDDPPAAGTVSLVTLDVGSQAHYRDGGTVAVARTVWTACTSQLRRHQVPQMVDLGRGRVQATVTPALGPNAQTRLRGCLEDATVDRLQLDVAEVRNLGR